jgi:hypothetical protein
MSLLLDSYPREGKSLMPETCSRSRPERWHLRMYYDATAECQSLQRPDIVSSTDPPEQDSYMFNLPSIT